MWRRFNATREYDDLPKKYAADTMQEIVPARSIVTGEQLEYKDSRLGEYQQGEYIGRLLPYVEQG